MIIITSELVLATKSNVVEKERALILRPLGAQGPKIAFDISSREQYVKFDEALGKLEPTERKTVAGILKAANSVGVNQVDS